MLSLYWKSLHPESCSMLKWTPGSHVQQNIGLPTLRSVAWATTCWSRVSDQGDNKGQWATHSLIKWLTSTASRLSLVVLILLIFLYDKNEKCLSHCHKISKWYDKQVLCYRRVKICNFTMSKQEPSNFVHLHARAPATAVAGSVDERMIREYTGGLQMIYIMLWCEVWCSSLLTHTFTSFCLEKSFTDNNKSKQHILNQLTYVIS